VASSDFARRSIISGVSSILAEISTQRSRLEFLNVVQFRDVEKARTASNPYLLKPSTTRFRCLRISFDSLRLSLNGPDDWICIEGSVVGVQIKIIIISIIISK